MLKSAVPRFAEEISVDLRLNVHEQPNCQKMTLTSGNVNSSFICGCTQTKAELFVHDKKKPSAKTFHLSFVYSYCNALDITGINFIANVVGNWNQRWSGGVEVGENSWRLLSFTTRDKQRQRGFGVNDVRTTGHVDVVRTLFIGARPCDRNRLPVVGTLCPGWTSDSRE